MLFVLFEYKKNHIKLKNFKQNITCRKIIVTITPIKYNNIWIIFIILTITFYTIYHLIVYVSIMMTVDLFICRSIDR